MTESVDMGDGVKEWAARDSEKLKEFQRRDAKRLEKRGIPKLLRDHPQLSEYAPPVWTVAGWALGYNTIPPTRTDVRHCLISVFGLGADKPTSSDTAARYEQDSTGADHE